MKFNLICFFLATALSEELYCSSKDNTIFHGLGPEEYGYKCECKYLTSAIACQTGKKESKKECEFTKEEKEKGFNKIKCSSRGIKVVLNQKEYIFDKLFCDRSMAPRCWSKMNIGEDNYNGNIKISKKIVLE
ncbi:hypothetical protein K502DRAFT_353298 [Neoconidiobolus thromboides FSU 785]|nr:hypothetical protein K502DRAFT_353298 [Neoconidiobolus thromboides FSU 785]